MIHPPSHQSLYERYTSSTNIWEHPELVRSSSIKFRAYFERTSHASEALILSSDPRTVPQYLGPSSDKVITGRTIEKFAFWRTWEHFRVFWTPQREHMYVPCGIIPSVSLSHHSIIYPFVFTSFWSSSSRLMFNTWDISLFRTIFHIFHISYILCIIYLFNNELESPIMSSG